MYNAKTNIWKIEHSDIFEKVGKYLDKIRNKISIVKGSYKAIKDVIRKYLEATKQYMNTLQSIALDLQPNGLTSEGLAIQAIQGILLFTSDSLEILVKQVQILYKNLKANKESNSAGLDDLSKIYQIKFSSAIQAYCDFINDNESYEKYLIHKELNISDKDIHKTNNENKNKNNNLDQGHNIEKGKNPILKRKLTKEENKKLNQNGEGQKILVKNETFKEE